MTKAYLRGVKISEGQFSSESSVALTDYNGDRYSGFTQNCYLKNGMLEGKILKEEGDLVLIDLPASLMTPTEKGILDVSSIAVKKTEIVYQ